MVKTVCAAVLLFAVLLQSFAISGAEEYMPKAALEAIERSQARIEVHAPLFNGVDDPDLGSGFLVSDDGLVLTAFHIMAKAPQSSIILFGGSPGKVQETFPAADLAVIKLDKIPEGMKLAVLAKDVPLYTDVYGKLIGTYFFDDRSALYNLPFRAKVVDVVSTLQETPAGFVPDGAEYIYMDKALKSGFSGGMIVNEKGEVVGMGRSYDGGFSIAVSVRVLRHVLSELQAKNK